MHGQTSSLELLEHDGVDTAGEDATDVYCWRMEQLLGAGYSHLVADILARESYVDLHVACDLMTRGCEERTAYMILL